jgi:hypothetical protein
MQCCFLTAWIIMIHHFFSESLHEHCIPFKKRMQVWSGFYYLENLRPWALQSCSQSNISSPLAVGRKGSGSAGSTRWATWACESANGPWASGWSPAGLRFQQRCRQGWTRLREILGPKAPSSGHGHFQVSRPVDPADPSSLFLDCNIVL